MVTVAAKVGTAPHVPKKVETAAHDRRVKRNRLLCHNRSRASSGSGQVGRQVLKCLPDVTPGRPCGAEKPRRVPEEGENSRQPAEDSLTRAET